MSITFATIIMKNLLLAFACWRLIVSQAFSQAQIFQMRSEKLKLKGENYSFENDTIQIFFAFWAEKGAFNFKIQNKKSQPLYVDWFKTILIAGSHQLNFYTSDTSADFRSFIYQGPIDDLWFGTGYGTENTPPRVINNDRKTFIPPKGNYYSFNRRVFHILPIDYFSIPERCDRNYEQPHTGRGKPVIVLSKSWSKRESPLILRFYLTLCTDEELKQCWSYDYEFFLNQFYECPQEHFKGRLQSSGTYSYSYRRQDSFYILYPEK